MTGRVFAFGAGLLWEARGPMTSIRERGPYHAGQIAAAVPPGSVVHVHPEGAAHLEPETFLTGAEAAGWVVSGEPAWFVRIKRAGGPATVIVLDQLAGASAGPWAAARTASKAGRALTIYHRAMESHWGPTVGTTAQALIMETHPPKRGGVQLVADPDVPAVCWDNLESAWHWRRPLTRTEHEAGFVHVFDANAQFLSPWQSTDLGMGSAIYQAGPVPPRLDRPGFWRLEQPLPDQPSPALLPPVWGPGPVYSTVTLARAREVLGELPAAAEGWFWPEQSRYLRGAGCRIRDARAVLLREARVDPEARMALEAVKSLYRVMTGRLESETVHAEKSPWRRPDWALLIKATARCNLHRRLSSLSGAVPFVIVTDGLVFVDDERDPLSYAQRIGLPLGDGLGHYSHKLTLSVDEQLRAQLLEASPTVVMKALRGAASLEEVPA